MANSSLRGKCVAPFLDASLFPDHGGSIDDRLCAEIALLPESPTCCLPCPAVDYVYSDRINSYSRVADWLHVAGLVLMCFMLLSYLVLPVQHTRSHYLSVCLVISVMMIGLGFTIPLGASPERCYNEITPNDMYTSMACALGGAFNIAGGLTVIMWVFIRALSMNLQICWDIVPGRRFFCASQVLGWGIPAVMFCIAFTITGVSFRFGNACHVNHKTALADFWGPLIVFSGAAGILQLTTLVYCAHACLQNYLSDNTSYVSSNASSTDLPLHQTSVNPQTAHAIFRRLKKVLWLQWRGIWVATVILFDVIFFTIIFLRLDKIQRSVLHDFDRVMPWLLCLAANPSDKNQCLDLAKGWLVSEEELAAVLLLLSLVGFQLFILLFRPSIFTAWLDLFRSRAAPGQQDLVSLHVRRTGVRSNSKAVILEHKCGQENTAYELQTKDQYVISASPLGSPESSYQSPLQKQRSSTIRKSLDSSSPYRNRELMPPKYNGRSVPSPGKPPNAWPHLYHRPGFQRAASNDHSHGNRVELIAKNRVSEKRSYQ